MAARVLVAGTFEYLHPGHVALLKRAARHGEVWVVVSRDANARKAKDRRISVPELLRLRMVSSLSIVRRAVLGGRDGLLGGIRKVKPSVIFLGPDQMPTKTLRSLLAGTEFSDVRILRMRRKVGGWKSSKLVERMWK